jgi:hypothetical protein
MLIETKYKESNKKAKLYIKDRKYLKVVEYTKHSKMEWRNEPTARWSKWPDA